MLAGKYRGGIEGGGDPHGDKIKAREEIELRDDATLQQQQLDVEKMWGKYMQQVASQLRSRGEKDRIFRRYILREVRGRLVTDITKAHALKIIDPLVTQDKRRMADKVRQEGAAFFQWLIERDHVDRNVFAGVRKASVGKAIRARVLSDDELTAIWRASEPEGRWGLWIKLLILTGARNMEGRGACWSEFDIDARKWTIPSDRSKNGRPHTIYLTDAMLAVIRDVPRFRDVDLVFPAAGNFARPMSGDQKVKDRVDKRMREALGEAGCREPDNWCLHDFRRTIATGLQRLGFRPDIADQVIGHVGSTRGGAGVHYLHHKYEYEKRGALEAWSAYVTGLARPPACTSEDPHGEKKEGHLNSGDAALPR